MPKVIRSRPKVEDDEEFDDELPSSRSTLASPYEAQSLRERIGAYALGSVVGLAAVIAAAAWLGGSLGSVGVRMSSGLDAVMRSAGLTVDKIVVVGLDPLLEQRARDAAMLEPGESMLAADPLTIKARVEELDAVGGVSVQRLWPDQITIIAETREPVALWRDGETWKVIDQHGEVFVQADMNDHLHLPRISGADGNHAAPALLAALGDYPELAIRLDGAERIGGRRWDIRFEEGVDVALPADDGMGEALRALNFLQAQNRILELPVSRIDARHPDRFALRPLPGAPSSSELGGA
ncbi:MAG: cell division protein FtsQ/DivIB [Alphaproteobacteria bacterium]|nr:cell division protein FtsQ/DivIB [Alphaproteobacteria bacterium]